MKPFLADPDLTVWQGEVLDVLAELPDESVDCVVTSPPYWGLRDYQAEGQIGLERTPELYVARIVEVFGEVRRVLSQRGTLWLNMGDSYASGNRGWYDEDDLHRGRAHRRRPRSAGAVKPKDLLGVPWRLAFALQEPRYVGRIPNELDRVWLAAMVEAEGCLFVHKRKAGTDSGARYKRKDGTERSYARTADSYGAGLEVSSTDRVIVERCLAIAGVGSICEQSPEANPRRKRTIYRWNVRSNECRWIIRELYPHMVAKQHEARLLLGCPSSGEDARKAHESLKALHQGQTACIDFGEPEGMWERGWFLRSEIIWAKCRPNPMPESVTDRPTKSHETVFLFSKEPTYHYDREAVLEPYEAKTAGTWSRASYDARNEVPAGKRGTYRREYRHPVLHAPPQAETLDPSLPPEAPRGADGRRKTSRVEYHEGRQAHEAYANAYGGERWPGAGRNMRSVWTIPVQPYHEAHFAVFPEELPRRCIEAGCPPGGVVLDPFAGSGTTGFVARALGRRAVLVELNPDYCELIAKRTQQLSLLGDEAA